MDNKTGSEKKRLVIAIAGIVVLNVLTYHKAMDIFFHGDGLQNLVSFYNPETGKVDRFDKIEHLNLFEFIPFFTWYLLYQGWGLNPVPYHITSLVFHTLVCIELFLLIRFMTSRWGVAILSALLYSIFYLNSQVVLWENSLFHAQAMFFSLAGVLVFLRFSVGASAPADNVPLQATIVVTVLFVLALMSKGTAIVTPLILTLLCRGLLGSGFRLRHYLPFLALPPAYAAYLFLGPPSDSAHEAIRGLGHSVGAFTCLLAYGVVPFNLPTRKLHILGAVPLLLIFSSLYYLLRSDSDRRCVRLLFPLMVVAIIPVSVAGFGYEGRYVYYPCMFTFPVLFIFMYELASRLGAYVNLSGKRIVTVIAAVLLISNYCTVQRLIPVYREAGAHCLKDLEAGQLVGEPRWLVRTQPRLMAPTVWLNGWFYEGALTLYNIEKGRKGRLPPPSTYQRGTGAAAPQE